MRFRSTPTTARRTRLALTPLEARDVPAGLVTATLSGAGLLSLVGDAQANDITILVTGGANPTVTLTAGGSTAINAAMPGVTVVLPGAIKSLSAKMGDGNDSLAIDGAAAFALTGAATIDLGGGTNTLTLSTTDKIDLGKLTVTGGDGNDTVTVRGGVGKGSQILGAAQFNLGVGAANVTLGGNGVAFGDLNVKGALGVTADGGTNGVVVSGDHVTVGGATSLKTKGYQATASLAFTDSTLHAVSATGYVATIGLANSTVTGNVSAAGGFAGGVTIANKPVTGNVSATGGFQTAVSITAATVTGNVTANSGFATQVTLGTTAITGNVTAGSKFQST